MKPFVCPKCGGTEIRVTAPTSYQVVQQEDDPEFGLYQISIPILDNDDPAECEACSYYSIVREFYRGE